MNNMQKDFVIGLLYTRISNDLSNTHDFEQIKLVNSFIESIAGNLVALRNCINAIEVGKTYLGDGHNLFIDKGAIIVKMSNASFVYPKDLFVILLTEAICFMQPYLPLGSIVVCDDKMYMVEQRMVQQKGKDYYNDYRLVPYPTGVFVDSMYLYIQSDEIREVIFTGYTDAEDEGYELAIKENLINNKIYSSYFKK